MGSEKGRNAPFGATEDGPCARVPFVLALFDDRFSDYACFISVVVFGAAMAILTILIGVGVCVSRYWLECCGGNEPDPGGYRFVFVVQSVQ